MEIVGEAECAEITQRMVTHFAEEEEKDREMFAEMLGRLEALNSFRKETEKMPAKNQSD